MKRFFKAVTAPIGNDELKFRLFTVFLLIGIGFVFKYFGAREVAFYFVMMAIGFAALTALRVVFLRQTAERENER